MSKESWENAQLFFAEDFCLVLSEQAIQGFNACLLKMISADGIIPGSQNMAWLLKKSIKVSRPKRAVLGCSKAFSEKDLRVAKFTWVWYALASGSG